jgi:hypothetical protein
MSDLTLITLLCTLAGATLKLADIFSERGDTPTLCFLISGTSGILIGILITFDRFSSAVFSGIVLGVMFAGKVDCPCLGFGLIMVAVTAWLSGPKTPALIPLVVIVLASFIDEIAHDRYQREAGSLGKFFKYRGMLKSAIVLLMLLGIMPFRIAGMFYLFDLTYDLTPKILNIQG